MRTKLLCAALALTGVVAVGLSADRPSTNTPTRAPGGPGVGQTGPEKTLREYYGPNYQWKINSEYLVNGIKCVSATVHSSSGDADADFTANGDLITMGVPQAFSTLTPLAAETATMFKVPPTSVTREDIHGYWVTIKGSGNHPYIIQFDAAGRIRTILSPEQIIQDHSNQQKVGGPQARHITDVVMQRFAKVQVEQVTIAGNDPGYFVVPFRAPAGQGWCIINEANDCTEWRFPESFGELPPAVREAVKRELHDDRVVSVEFGAARLYRVTQMVGGEAVEMLLKSDGEIDWISTHQLHAHRFDKK